MGGDTYLLAKSAAKAIASRRGCEEYQNTMALFATYFTGEREQSVTVLICVTTKCSVTI